MIPHQFFYLMVVLALLWLFFMLHVAWPSQGGVTLQRPGEPEPITPRRNPFQSTSTVCGPDSKASVCAV
jgi:hypothetical protein